jgi:hypothetical protein
MNEKEKKEIKEYISLFWALKSYEKRFILLNYEMMNFYAFLCFSCRK